MASGEIVLRWKLDGCHSWNNQFSSVSENSWLWLCCRRSHAPEKYQHIHQVPPKKCTCFTPLKQYHVSNAKPTGPSNCATPPMPVSPSIWLHLPVIKASSSRVLSAPYFGLRSADSCLDSALAMNSSVVMKSSTATLRAMDNFPGRHHVPRA